MKPVHGIAASALVAGGILGSAITSLWPAGGGHYRYVVCHRTASGYTAQVVRDHVSAGSVAPAVPTPPDYQIMSYDWDQDPCPAILP